MTVSIRWAAVLLGIASQVTGAQGTIASRVSAIRDGVVHMEYASRPGVCGNGRDMIAYKHAMYAKSFEGWGTYGNTPCTAGPVRVTLSIAGGVPTSLRTQIGGSWPQTSERVTDLGSVSSREAAAYVLALVPALESESGKDRVLLAAVLADDAQVIQPLLTLARDEHRTNGTRGQAIQWLGTLGDASIIPALVSFARETSESEKKSIGTSALAALSHIDDNAGIPALLQLSRDGSTVIRRESAFWLGQSGDPRAFARLHQMIEDGSEDINVRSHAIFSLANGDHDARQLQYLRDVYPRLAESKLKDAIFQGMSQDDASGGKWLMQRARDAAEPTEVRKKALFWAGQGEATSTSDIVALYREVKEPSLKEHVIFVLSQRDDHGGTDALLNIARSDDDKRMRGKALFWLAQKNDPRVTKLISDILVKE